MNNKTFFVQIIFISMASLFVQVHAYNKKDLHELNKGVASFNTWRALPKNKDRLIDLSYADLHKRNLTGVNFTDASLRGANLRKTNLHDALLDEADFSCACLEDADLSTTVTALDPSCDGAIFSHADLTNAKFNNRYINGCQFAAANLTNTDFTAAIMVTNNFLEATLIGTIFASINGTNLRFDNTCLKYVDFTAATLRACNFDGVTFEEVITVRVDFDFCFFRKSRLICLQAKEGCAFNSTLCQGANFSGARFERASFIGANLTGAFFCDADCQGITFLYTNCQRSIGNNINFEGASLDFSSFEQALLQDANLSSVDGMKNTRFVSADMSNATLLNATIANANFRLAKLECATMPDGSTYDFSLSREYEEIYKAEF